MNNPEAIARIRALSPQVAASIEDAAYQRGERKRADETRDLLGEYFTADTQPMNTVSPVAPAAAPGTSSAIGALLGADKPVATLEPAAAMPGGGRADVLNRLARVNPEMRLKLGDMEAAQKLKQLETHEKINEYGINLLATATDQASYDAAVSRYHQLLQKFGMEPVAVPPTYSPETIRRLEMSLLDAKDRLEAAKGVVISDGGELRNPYTGVLMGKNEKDPQWLATGTGEFVLVGPDGPVTRPAAPGGGGAPSPAPGGGRQPRGIRNNNPGNIEATDWTRSQPGFVGDDGRFAKFASYEDGVRAGETLVRNYIQRGYNTIEEIVNRWAPASENGASTANYVRYVAERVGVDPRSPVNGDLAPRIFQAKIEFENGMRPGGGGGAQPVKVGSPKMKIEETRSINGQVLVKVNGQWYKKKGQ